MYYNNWCFTCNNPDYLDEYAPPLGQSPSPVLSVVPQGLKQLDKYMRPRENIAAGASYNGTWYWCRSNDCRNDADLHLLFFFQFIHELYSIPFEIIYGY